MRVLIVDRDPAQQRRFAKMVEGLGHSATAASDARAAMGFIETGGIDLLFMEWALPGKSGELVRWVRAREAGLDEHLYVLVATHRSGPEIPLDALAAGADDCVSKDGGINAVASKLRVAERLVTLELRLRQRLRELSGESASAAGATETASTTALAPVAPGLSEKRTGNDAAASRTPTQAEAAPEILDGLSTWKTLQGQLCDALQANVPLSFASTTANKAPGPNALAATISLTDVEHHVQIQITLVTEQSHAKAMACAIFGDPSMVDDEIVPDTLLELANGVMGSLKSSFLAEDYSFTAGIPEAVSVRPAHDMLDGARDQRIFAFRSSGADGAELCVLVGVRQNGNKKVAARNLIDGMVLAEAVFNGSGILLLKSGTRLSEVMIERLSRINPEMVVELAA